MMYELLCGAPPFVNATEIEGLKQMVRNFKGFGYATEWKVDTKEAQMLLDQLKRAKASERAKDLLSRLLHPDMGKRITAAEALNHPWLCEEGHGEHHMEHMVNRLNMSVGRRKFRRAITKIILLHKLKKGQIKHGHDGAELQYPGGLLSAVNEEDEDLAQQEICAAMDRGEHINGRNASGQTALMVAIARRSTSAAAQLLSLRADPNLHDEDGRDALMYAAQYGDAKTAARLLDLSPALKNNKDNNGASALTIADNANQAAIRSVIETRAHSHVAATAAKSSHRVQSSVAAAKPTTVPEKNQVCSSCGIS